MKTHDKVMLYDTCGFLTLPFPYCDNVYIGIVLN